MADSSSELVTLLDELLNAHLTSKTDTTLSSTSGNPVANKTINTALGEYTKTKNLATVATSGSYTDLSNTPTIPTVPTKVSAFTNDAGYLTSHQDLSAYAKTAELAAVATSGTFASLISKPTTLSGYGITDANISSNKITLGSNTITLANVATSGSYNDLSNKPTIPTVPTKVSAFTNDVGYLTSHQSLADYVKSSDLASVATVGTFASLTSKPTTLSGYGITDASITSNKITLGSNSVTLATVATSGSYNDLSNKPTIPSAVTVDSALSSTSTNPVQNKIINTALSGKVAMSGSRGSLAGYETASSGSTVSATSADAQTSSSAVTVSNGTSGTSWTKIVTLTSAVTVTLGSSWKWQGGSAPTIVANGILVCCWCGAIGIANFISPS